MCHRLIYLIQLMMQLVQSFMYFVLFSTDIEILCILILHVAIPKLSFYL